MKPIDLNYIREDLSYSFRTLSLFFYEPVTIRTPQETFVVGDGPGGYSYTLFVRGFTCSLCGRCCYGNHARGRTWMPGESAPWQASPVECEVNGISFPIHAYI